MLKQVDHINIVVADLEMMVGFYRDVLGFEVTREATISGQWIGAVVGLKGVVGKVVYLELAVGPRVELIEYVSPAGPRPAGMDQANTQGMRHMAFEVDDIQAVAATLKQRGVKMMGDVQIVSHRPGAV